jgi:uncharacterized protein
MSPNKIWQALTWLLTLACLSAPLRAESVKQLKPSGYVNDFAGVIDASSSESMRQICQQVDEKAHAQIAIVTVHSLDGSDIESYAADLYKEWGIGPKSSNRGVLILLAIDDHRSRIEVGYGLEPILPDGKVGGFGREAVPLLKQNQYGPGILLMTQRVAEVIAADAGIKLENINTPPNQSAPDSVSNVLAVLVPAFIILFIVGFVIRGLIQSFRGGGSGGGPRSGGGGLSNLLTLMLLSNIGRGGGGGGGSSWGGGGGFGGGSGGGGASGSW